jgi:hypothetical protein
VCRNSGYAQLEEEYFADHPFRQDQPAQQVDVVIRFVGMVKMFLD